jgi:hypothetical protein
VVTVQPSWIVLGTAILGGLIGLFQMPQWQLSVLLGIVLGRLLTTVGRPLTAYWANRLSLLVRFALRGGLSGDDPGAVLAKVRELPPLVGGDGSSSLFSLVLFGSSVIATYLFGRWRFRPRPANFGPLLIYPVSKLQRIVSGGLGAINGYLIARFLIPLVFPGTETIVKVPGTQLTTFLDNRLHVVAMGFVLVMILLGLQASSRGRT